MGRENIPKCTAYVPEDSMVMQAVKIDDADTGLDDSGNI